MIAIKLTRGFETVIDEIDSDLAQYKWYSNGSPPYASRQVNNKILRMHRLILARKVGRELLADEIVDHIDGDSLNNTRDNLRVANRTTNTYNRKGNKNNKSGFRGVCRVSNGWKAQISVNGKVLPLGVFQNINDAADAYKKASVEYHGQFGSEYKNK